MSLRLNVPGMSCQGCVGKVQSALQQLPGAGQVNVSRGDSLVEITGPISLPDALGVLESIGYPGSERPLEASIRAPEKFSAEFYRTGVALLSMGVLMLGEWCFGWGMSPWFEWASGVVATVVMAVAGRHFFVGAWRQLQVGRSNMDTLVSVGGGAAYALSVYGLFFPGSLQHLYFMESTAIIALISLGHGLEAWTTQRAERALRALLKGSPSQTVRLDRKGGEEVVPIEQLQPGDQVLVRPGESLPVDGRMTSDWALLDESLLTGESTPVRRVRGEKVLGGSMNVETRLEFTVQAVGESTVQATIRQRVRQAQQSRAAVQSLADRLSSLLVVAVLILSLVTLLGWGWRTTVGWETAAIRAISVLIVACPCAMSLATPAALMVAVALAARRGVLIRGAEALEKCGHLTRVMFDKTGTLTEGWGKFDETFLAGVDPIATGSLVRAMARSSSHPVAQMLAQHYKDSPAALLDSWRELRGQGCEAVTAGRIVRLGSLSWLRDAGVQVESGNRTSIGLAIGDQLQAQFRWEPRIKPEAARVIAQLQNRGLQVHLVTGDQQEAGEELAAQVGIPRDRVHGGLLPAQKAELIASWQSAGERVAFIGDGINDGPALAQAELGIAVLSASDLARESADVILLRPDIEAIPEILSLSGATLRIIQQNFVWALIYNALAIPLAMAGWVSPIVCAGAMGLSDLCVVGNSLRLFLWKPSSATAVQRSSVGPI